MACKFSNEPCWTKRWTLCWTFFDHRSGFVLPLMHRQERQQKVQSQAFNRSRIELARQAAQRQVFSNDRNRQVGFAPLPRHADAGKDFRIFKAVVGFERSE